MGALALGLGRGEVAEISMKMLSSITQSLEILSR